MQEISFVVTIHEPNRPRCDGSCLDEEGDEEPAFKDLKRSFCDKTEALMASEGISQCVRLTSRTNSFKSEGSWDCTISWLASAESPLGRSWSSHCRVNVADMNSKIVSWSGSLQVIPWDKGAEYINRAIQNRAAQWVVRQEQIQSGQPQQHVDVERSHWTVR
jgi:hypothetical protein